jgi:hypothetical protein
VVRESGEEAAIKHLRQILPGILESEDAAEGVKSFLERREGNFTGT